jgi:hypothetical protein
LERRTWKSPHIETLEDIASDLEDWNAFLDNFKDTALAIKLNEWKKDEFDKNHPQSLEPQTNRKRHAEEKSILLRVCDKRKEQDLTQVHRLALLMSK